MAASNRVVSNLVNYDIKVDQFCSLATDADWQVWLYKYDSAMYQDFSQHLATSRGCSANREKMMTVFEQIKKRGDDAKLLEWIIQHRSNILRHKPNPKDKPKEHKVKPSKAVMAVGDNENDGVFSYYMPNLMTLPRRMILKANGENIQQIVDDFIADKPVADYVIIKDKAYVEYLDERLAHLADGIPPTNWETTIFKEQK